MRVLHIGKFYPPYPGGIENFSAELAETVVQDQTATAVLAHTAPGIHHTQRYIKNGVDVTLAACHGQFVYAPISPAFPWLLSRTILRFKPDLLHLHLPNTSAFWALLSPAARRLPWIIHWHSDVPLDAAQRKLRLAYRLYRPWEQALLQRAKAIIATSRRYLDSSAALAPWRDKTRIIPLGLGATSPPTQSCNWPENIGMVAPLRLLAVGRLAYYKGHDILLHALAKTPAAVLLLVGSGERKAALKKLAQDIGIAARVRFAGAIDDAELAAAYASADVFCLPSIERSEAFGLVLLEAMRAGLPVVASAIPGSGVSHVVRDGETGLLVTPGNADVLASALSRLQEDSDFRIRLGQAGRQRWHEEFSMHAVATQTQKLYRTLLGLD
ncbi:glycosyltransferase [Pseudolysobacter antarcticus]|uniref:Glycosyltransferase n=1 Tax=Pseudolysobacter antarcticus TaxID=2511995 RepID=A0A411HLK1_9GAMM|nr:glycosyltransferase [Pseudolysobacter antarcticus]QBB71368.1 glycosyltransferase [Pseudolysobacter antarcticus]